MNYYPFHLGDYSAHTAHLEPLEDLAYRRMLDAYYLRESPLPADVQDVSRLIRMRGNMQEVNSVLIEFFTLSDEGWRHSRCDEEIVRMQDKQAKARSSAAASVSARKAKTENLNNGRSASVERTLSERSTDVELPTPTPTPTPIEPTNPKGLVVASDADADLLGQAIATDKTVPNCPHETLLALYAECLPSLPQPRAWEGQAADNLRARWRWVLTATGRGSGKRYATTSSEAIEWFRRFFDYVAGSDFLMGRKADWQADIRWLVKAANFDKVLSGAYENERATA